MMGFNEKIVLTLSGDLKAALSEMAEATKVKRPADVVRNAITIYHTIIKQNQAGNATVIMVKQEDGSIKQVPVLKQS